ncbi:hypothetical protein [Mycoplasmopsis gallinarum]|uniref:hypothetical protein n=1 Tax=Mycoplasmopsis gallinarum TaxID=29557 RepID=UPI0004898847|nr:hypothetical protein [Mycoplasmopsis gallinarum]
MIKKNKHSLQEKSQAWYKVFSYQPDFFKNKLFSNYQFSSLILLILGALIVLGIMLAIKLKSATNFNPVNFSAIIIFTILVFLGFLLQLYFFIFGILNWIILNKIKRNQSFESLSKSISIWVKFTFKKYPEKYLSILEPLGN